MKKLLSVLLVLLLVPLSVLGELVSSATPVLVDQGLELGIHSLHYPQLTGGTDEALQAAINDRILEAGDITYLMARLGLVLSSEVPLTVSWEGTLTNDILSVTMDISGPVKDTRSTQLYACVNLDVATGYVLTFADLFSDPDAAVADIEAYLEEQVAPVLSGYLEHDELLPLPETWSLSSSGITFYYPIDQLSTLSSRAGAVTILWYELADELLLGEGTVLRRIGAEANLTLTQDTPALLAEALSGGRLPDLPVGLGDSMQQATDTHHLLIDPDLCEGGRLFSLEDSRFRDVYLLTDDLTRTWENSVVQGIRCDRLNLYGLITGHAAREDWLTVLGEPETTLTLDADRAEAWRLEPGISDYYTLGNVRLRLHCGEDGLLSSVFLLPGNE